MNFSIKSRKIFKQMPLVAASHRRKNRMPNSVQSLSMKQRRQKMNSAVEVPLMHVKPHTVRKKRSCRKESSRFSSDIFRLLTVEVAEVTEVQSLLRIDQMWREKQACLIFVQTIRCLKEAWATKNEFTPCCNVSINLTKH